eukprot:654540-Rhodomonas_salina.1
MIVKPVQATSLFHCRSQVPISSSDQPGPGEQLQVAAAVNAHWQFRLDVRDSEASLPWSLSQATGFSLSAASDDASVWEYRRRSRWP